MEGEREGRKHKGREERRKTKALCKRKCDGKGRRWEEREEEQCQRIAELLEAKRLRQEGKLPGRNEARRRSRRKQEKGPGEVDATETEESNRKTKRGSERRS